VFTIGKPSLMFGVKSRSLLYNGVPERYFAQVRISLTQKH